MNSVFGNVGRGLMRCIYAQCSAMWPGDDVTALGADEAQMRYIYAYIDERSGASKALGYAYPMSDALFVAGQHSQVRYHTQIREQGI